MTVVSVSASPYNIISTDEFIVITAGIITVNLPAATGSRRILNIKNISVSDATLSPNGSDTIDGVSGSQTLNEYDSITVIDYSAAKWAIL
jgi:hypothetical protein